MTNKIAVQSAAPSSTNVKRNSTSALPSLASASSQNVVTQTACEASPQLKINRPGYLREKAKKITDRIVEGRYSFPVRYPLQTEIIRVASESRLCVDGWPMVMDPTTDEVWLVALQVFGRGGLEFFDISTWIGFALAMSHHGESFLWPYLSNTSMKLAAEEAVLCAKNHWVRVRTDTAAADYHIDSQTWRFPEPNWPNLTNDKLVDVVFGQREIRRSDHPVLERIREAANA